jgi:hypothetical protein
MERSRDEEMTKTLSHCIEHLTECISLPWTKLSRKRKILCFLCRGKTYQRLKQYENSIADLTRCILLYQRKDRAAAAVVVPEKMTEEGVKGETTSTSNKERNDEEEDEDERIDENENEQDEDFDETDAAYAFFRRGWSYKVRYLSPSTPSAPPFPHTDLSLTIGLAKIRFSSQ